MIEGFKKPRAKIRIFNEVCVWENFKNKKEKIYFCSLKKLKNGSRN